PSTLLGIARRDPGGPAARLDAERLELRRLHDRRGVGPLRAQRRELACERDEILAVLGACSLAYRPGPDRLFAARPRGPLLEREVRMLQRRGARYLHLDVIDPAPPAAQGVLVEVDLHADRAGVMHERDHPVLVGRVVRQPRGEEAVALRPGPEAVA